MDEETIKRWVANGIEVHATWATGTGTQAVGRVVAYCAAPTVLIERDDGETVHVSTDCTLTERTHTDQREEGRRRQVLAYCDRAVRRAMSGASDYDKGGAEVAFRVRRLLLGDDS